MNSDDMTEVPKVHLLLQSHTVQVNLLKDQDMTYGKNPIGICNM